jgi:signal transduction histidine kinase
MNQSVSIEELKKVIAFRDLPDEHLEWILNHSEYYEHEDGYMITKTGDPIDVMWILLEGKVAFYKDVNGQLIYYFGFENNEIAGGVGGLMPFSRMKASPGASYAVGKIRGLKLHKKYFPELEKLNPDLIQKLIGYMTERARIFATKQMQQEKVSSLGKLAAGIAHELNNPAAAINWISEELNKRLTQNFHLTEYLLKCKIDPVIIRNIREMVLSKDKNSKKTKLTPMQRIEKEDEIKEWLESKGIEETHDLSQTFTDSGFSIDDLEKIHSDIGNEAFHNILNWLENLLSSEMVIKDLEHASGRITLLVDAIKSHVHMDRSDSIHKTDIHHDLENTILLLGYKIREKNISLKKLFSKDMPEVEAYPGELNQVWTNIIDNAIHAVPQYGELVIETSHDKNNIYVRITDNGTGIPSEIISRIFDPFFTTKKVGEGTGIGLDIVQNVIRKHNGEVKVNSEPGKTVFEICLPVIHKTLNKEKEDETAIHYNN